MRWNWGIQANPKNSSFRLVCKWVYSCNLIGSITVKRPRMLSTPFVALNKPCKPKPELPTHICVIRPQWVTTEKDNELASPGRFSNQIIILNIQSTRGILRFGVILSKALIYRGYFRFLKSWCRQHFNWLSYFYWIQDLAHSIRWLLFVRSRCDQTLDWY